MKIRFGFEPGSTHEVTRDRHVSPPRSQLRVYSGRQREGQGRAEKGVESARPKAVLATADVRTTSPPIERRMRTSSTPPRSFTGCEWTTEHRTRSLFQPEEHIEDDFVAESVSPKSRHHGVVARGTSV
ncbi:hypothetical protein JTE90_024424 [Oedothorax gibbosus]|uniref:Uncharacterized protein n=1 Tax=Oedothorax gibbosus TaxID=931172 RepID=A0AAV6UH69_9ARAC|nr:hypothetical protein JTE90_024424 [Oedothorax gibbosus]